MQKQLKQIKNNGVYKTEHIKLKLIIMKNFKSIIAILAISFATVFTTNANNEDPKSTKKELRTEIVSILGVSAPFELQKSVTTDISFLINNNNEVVIVDVDANNVDVENFVKSRLNYKKIATKGITKGEIYRVPVTIKAI